MAERTVGFTRQETAEHARGAFERSGGAGRRDVLEAPRDSGAPYAMMELVASRIPEQAHLRDVWALWVYLRDVPPDREAA